MNILNPGQTYRDLSVGEIAKLFFRIPLTECRHAGAALETCSRNVIQSTRSG